MFPLSGVRVIDLSRMMAGPATAMLLADLGADVVKIEPPAGDDLRYVQPEFAPEAAPLFLAVNRNKRGIVLDIQRAEGLAVLKRLLQRADVLVHNLRPGSAARLGLSYEELSATDPRLVYCSISAWGERGPWMRRPGVDSLIQAASGMMSITGEPDGAWLRSAAPIVDMTTPLAATVAVLAALIDRDRSGLGQKVETSLLAQGLFMQGPLFSYTFHTGQNIPRMGNRSPLALMLEAQTRTGGLLISIPTQKFWVKLCESIGVPELVGRSEYRTHALRLRSQHALAHEIEPRLRERPREHWLERFASDGVPCAPINDYGQTLEEEQVRAIEPFLEIEHPVAGRAIVPNVPWRLGAAGAEVRRLPPTLGRDTKEVLREAGYSETEIRALSGSAITRGSFVEPT